MSPSRSKKQQRKKGNTGLHRFFPPVFLLAGKKISRYFYDKAANAAVRKGLQKLQRGKEALNLHGVCGLFS